MRPAFFALYISNRSCARRNLHAVELRDLRHAFLRRVAPPAPPATCTACRLPHQRTVRPSNTVMALLVLVPPADVLGQVLCDQGMVNSRGQIPRPRVYLRVLLGFTVCARQPSSNAVCYTCSWHSAASHRKSMRLGQQEATTGHVSGNVPYGQGAKSVRAERLRKARPQGW